MKAKVKFYGVRGSTPTCGKEFNKAGGNTTCVFVETEKAKIIIDAGTGIRVLGNDLMGREFAKEGGHANLLFTHTHWDHIQGFPFFVPAYLPQNKFDIYGESKMIPMADGKGKSTKEEWDIGRTLNMQQFFMFFPASTGDMASELNYHEINPKEALDFNGVKVSSFVMFHPNNTLGFRFDFGEKSFVFCTDVEHNDEMIEGLAAFANGADVLAFDCQYTPEEYENGRKGWGHSTYVQAAEICKRGDIKELRMIHHDPTHSDQFLDDMQVAARKEFANATMVPEGLTLDF